MPTFIPKSNWITRSFLALAALGVSGFAAVARAADASHETFGPVTYWLPENASSYGLEIDHLFYGILYLTCFVCVAVFIALAVFVYRYRHQPGRRAVFIHGNNRLEIVWTIIPAVIMIAIVVLSETAWSKVKSAAQMPKGPDVLEMEVVGQQFQWNFHYPGADGKLGRRDRAQINAKSDSRAEWIGLDASDPNAKDDIVTDVMYIPVNKRVRIHLTSKDVIHSFFLPNFRLKQDALPGLSANLWLEATKTSAQVVGTDASGRPKPFDIVCAELCGQGHFAMRGQMFVVSQQQFDEFIAERTAEQLGGADEGY